MKFDLSKPLTNPRGEVFKDAKDKSVIIGDVIYDALGAFTEESLRLPGKDKLRCFDLGCKIATNGVHDLSAEDVVFIKGLCEKQLGTFAYGAVVTFLDHPMPEVVQDVPSTSSPSEG